MRFLRLVRCLLFLLFGLGLTLAVTLPARAATYTWNGGNGEWKVAANWSPPTGPPNGYDQAIIPGGTVTLDTLYSVKNLTLGAGATLLITQWGLNLVSDNPEKTCLVTNNGSIQVINPGPNTSGLGSAGGSIVTLTGGGEVVLGGPYNNMGNGGHGGSFINDTDHTIQGSGSINLNLTNKGQMIAENGTLKINGIVTNQGGSVGIQGAADSLWVTGQIIGGFLNLNDGNLILQGAGVGNLTLGPGTVEIREGATLLGNVTLPGSAPLTIPAGGFFNLSKAPDNTPAEITNQVTIQLNGGNSGGRAA